MITPFTAASTPRVQGFLHRPAARACDALVLTHGAGSNCEAPLLIALAEIFADSGFLVLRCDLPYRQKRQHGSPFRGEDVQDREGLRSAVEAIKQLAPAASRIFLGG